MTTSHHEPEAWRIFNERADEAHREFAAGEISADLYRGKLYALGFRGAEIDSEVSLHAPALVADTPRVSAILFNCCTDNRAPDWTRFKSVEVGGCIDHGGETEGNVPDDRAEFFTVYARLHDGCAEAITDSSTRPIAEFVARTIARLSGLPLI